MQSIMQKIACSCPVSSIYSREKWVRISHILHMYEYRWADPDPDYDVSVVCQGIVLTGILFIIAPYMFQTLQ